MKRKNRNISIAALVVAVTMSGWLLPACATKREETLAPETEISSGLNGGTEIGNGSELNTGNETNAEEPNENAEEPNVTTPAVTTTPQPEEEKAEYICVNATGLTLRSGAGTNYSAVGTAEKGTLYALCGRTGNWYKTYYKHKTVYLSAGYCSIVQMNKSADEQIEKVIEEGCKCLGVTYVYGATRYHDGSGKRLSGFTTSAFDCSSLMQYIFKLGAGVNLQVNTRTQIYQGTTVKKSALKRGDLMFFTNASRKNNTGVERVGHVALYLGNNYILHTASDYAKIEQISSTRWGYYIQSQRIL